MIKILTIIGARPQIIKAAALSRTINNLFSSEIEEIIVHTGQHYDFNMSQVFIQELSIPQPKYNLNVGSGKQGEQTAAMIIGLEKILLDEKPDWCVVYGDTNSTLAASVAASKINVPIAHIEAGLRSYNKTMPEELNRICCDHFSTILFAPTDTAVNNLQREGFNVDSNAPYSINNPAIINSGDIMLDNTLYFRELAKKNTQVLVENDIQNSQFILCTIHRQNNTDDNNRLKNILESVMEIADKLRIKIILPLHPRTNKVIKETFSPEFVNQLFNNNFVKIIDPVSFLDMILLENNSSLILTDSGGVQKEAYFLNKPCVILRNETEWTEIIEHETGILADANKEKIINSTVSLIENPPKSFPPLFGNGMAAVNICKALIEYK